MNNSTCAHLTIKWNTQETGGPTRGWWTCEMCHTPFVPQTIEPSLQQRLESASKLQELTLQNEIRWMQKHSESEKAHQETRTALESANSLCRSAYSIAERKGSETNWDSFMGQLKESLNIQHRVMYPEGRVVFPQPSPSPEQIKEAEMTVGEPPKDFKKELESLINKHSRENCSNTPDFLLVDYMMACLVAFENATNSRERWYGRIPQESSIQLTAQPAEKGKP